MTEIPPGMYRKERPKDQDFLADHYLYRRVRPTDWDGNMPAIDSLELPDMSVGWSKYGHPEWLRIDEDHLEDDECKDWGVIGFLVKDIPGSILHLGVVVWTFAPKHIPKADNYPHSEVWCYEGSKHVSAKKALDPDVHQRWRQKLLWKIKIFLHQDQEADCPQEGPK